MLERAPRFPFRRPAPLPIWMTLAGALQIGIFAVYHALYGLFGEIPPQVALGYGTACFLLYLLVLAAPPLLEKARLGHGSLARDWALFIGVYGALALLASTMRSLVTPWILGMPLAPEILLGLASNMMGGFLITLGGLEAMHAGIRFYRDQEHRNERLQRELAESRSRLVLTDDSLRREAAEYLHGEVQSRLLMAWMLIKQAQSEPDRRQALHQEAREHLESLQANGMSQARILMGISDRPLSERIEQLVNRFQTVLPIALEIAPEFREREKELDDELLTAATCMVEEGLLNTFRHAQAKRVVLRLEAEAERLALCVQDDGKGFDPQRHPRGLGLSGLGARLSALGGSWSLDSMPGSGTRLSVKLPSPRALEVPLA